MKEKTSNKINNPIGRFIKLASAATALSIAISGCSFFDGPTTPSEGIIRQAKADGFKGAEVDGAYSNKNVTLTLDLGNCAISGVDAQYHENKKGQVTDMDNYSFTGYAMATQQEVTRGGLPAHREVVTDGVPVEFKFQNLDDLKNNILGPEPCRTLANNQFIQ